MHSVYVISLPVGPIWALHVFYLATSWLMLIWCLRYERVSRPADLPLTQPAATVQAYSLRGRSEAWSIAWHPGQAHQALSHPPDTVPTRE